MRKPTGNGGSPLGPRGFGVAGLFVVPRLEELVADPWQVSMLDAHTARVLRTQAIAALNVLNGRDLDICLLYTSPSPRDLSTARMPSSA